MWIQVTASHGRYRLSCKAWNVQAVVFRLGYTVGRFRRLMKLFLRAYRLQVMTQLYSYSTPSYSLPLPPPAPFYQTHLTPTDNATWW